MDSLIFSQERETKSRVLSKTIRFDIGVNKKFVDLAMFVETTMANYMFLTLEFFIYPQNHNCILVTVKRNVSTDYVETTLNEILVLSGGLTDYEDTDIPVTACYGCC